MKTAKRLFAAFVSLAMVLQLSVPVPEALAQEPNNDVGVSAYAEESGAQGSTVDAGDTAESDTSASDAPTADTDSADTAETPTMGGESDSSSVQGTNAAASSSGSAESTGSEAPQQETSLDESAVEVQAGETYEIKTVGDLEKQLGSTATVEKSDGKATKIKADSPSAALIVLSHAEPSIYQNAELTLNNTGNGVDLTGTATVGSGTSAASVSFQGLGSKDIPFAGTVTNTNFKLAHSLFNGLDVSGKAEVSYELTWAIPSAKDGVAYTTEPMFANYVKSDNASPSLSVRVTLLNSTDYANATWSPLIDETAGSFSLSATYVVGDVLNKISVEQTGNAGMLVNTVNSGTLTLVGFSGNGLEEVNVTSSNGSAGYLVGQVMGGAGLSVDYEVNAPKGTVKSSLSSSGTTGITVKPGAGGIVGKVETDDASSAQGGGTVTINKSVNLENLTIGGYIAGGFVGRAKFLTLNIKEGSGTDKVVVAPALSVGTKKADDSDAEGEEAGALFGEVTFANAQTFNADNLALNTENGYTLNAKHFVGGLFGILGFPSGSFSSLPTVAVEDLTVKSSQWSKADKPELDKNGWGSGGIVGSLSWNGSKGKLSVRQTAVEYSCSQAGNLGGVVGTFWGPGVLSVDGVSVKASLPAGSSIGNKFGGVVGSSNEDRTNKEISVIANNFALSTEGGSNISKGGGVFGYASKYVRLKLSGTTDLSNVVYDSSDDAGQIVGKQNSALVFAAGSGNDDAWKLKRGSQTDLDDIGNYGEVIRLGGKLGSDFITLNPADGSLSINGGTTLAEGESSFSVKDEKDFALLAIAWQTRGRYSGVDGISESNWNAIQSSDISFAGDVDLSGTGITGLSRDDLSNDDAFSGTINGGGKKVTLAVGEPYGMRGDDVIDNSNDESAGNGKIYRHNALGLVAKGNGSVSNITIGGSIRFKSCMQIKAGAYAAVNDANDITVSNATFSPSILFSKDSKNAFCVGGIFGSLNGANSITFSGATASATMAPSNNERFDQYAYAGGAIGYVYDGATPAINVDGLTVSGSITADSASDELPMGGLIGYIDQPKSGSYKTVKISDVTFKDLSLNLKSNNAVGGLLGYAWAQTDVTIGGSGSAFAIKTANAKLSANGSKSVGGLAYHAGGKWTLNDNAVDFSGYTIDGVSGGNDGRLGLLACRGGKGSEYGINSQQTTMSSLYLEATANWTSSYKLDGITLSNVDVANFDEWVADTCEVSSEDIFKSEVNGVVSLRTTGDAANALNMSGNVSNRNSYVNRTSYGKNHETNKYSRYYYNLELCKAALGDAGNTGGASSPEGLLLWSVYNYIDSGIKDRYFGECGSSSLSGTFDMEGYSYYPIDYYGKSLDIKDSTFKFYNNEIEDEENGNKLTSVDSQHKGMHCGLLRNLTTDNPNTSLNASNIAFSGSIGKLSKDGNSGALVCGEVSGSTAGSTAYIYSLNINGCKLDGIRITGFDSQTEYAPLLLGSTASATALTVSNVSLGSGYTGGTCVATSLIGNVGNSSASRVTASFGTIALPSKSNDKIFSKATLLNAFSYSDAGSATYNFTKTDKENVTYGKEIDKTNKQGDSSQYYGKQLWYYGLSQDDDNNKVQDGEVKAGSDAFTAYLPYVANSYNASTKNYEIKVNHLVTDIVDGCGTYGHPYKISTEAQFSKVAEAVNMGQFSEGMKVRIVLDQSKPCSEITGGAGSNDVELTLAGDGFSGTKADGTPVNISKDTMCTYFRSAYYSITGNITVTNFAGLGQSTETAFRGVIVGNGGSITLNKTDGTTNYGLIRYSYGSVVKDLNITYSGLLNAVEYKAAGTISQTDNGTTNSYIPQSFFGGVIGCVLGGDNIIDGVSVSSNLLYVVSGSGSNPNLVPVGGYVGVVAGGGVLFRNSNGNPDALNSWHAKGSSAYDNPYLGRMLDGYAFSEGCDIDNGNNDSNYKINRIYPSNNGSSTGDVSASDFAYAGSTGGSGTGVKPAVSSTATINNAQGLLVLSGIINSGAAAGSMAGANVSQQGTRAYLGKTERTAEGYSFGNGLYGKVRNAQYNSIGNVASAGGDWSVALKDDTKAPGAETYVKPTSDAVGNFNSAIDGANTPYLVTAYANPETSFICASVRNTSICMVDIKFVDDTYDMTGYGSGYLGLSARYVTNAALDGSLGNGAKYTYSVNPQVTSIDGAGATLKVYKNEKEYAKDDFHTLGVGGLFCTAGFITPLQNFDPGTYQILKDLTISGSTISLSYYDANSLNDVTLSANTTQNQRLRSIVGVGGIAGILSPESNSYKGGQVEDVAVTGTGITSPATAGSLFGMAAYALRSTSENSVGAGVFAYADGNSDIAGMTMRLKNCSYDSVDIQADRWAGGFFGNLTTKNTNSGFLVTKENFFVGKDSTIHSKGKNLDMMWGQSDTYAGGLVGYAKSKFQINSFDDSASKTLVMENVEVSNDCTTWGGAATGGLIGRYESPTNCNIKDVVVRSSDPSEKKIIGKTSAGSGNFNHVGGLIGRSDQTDAKFVFTNCVIDSMNLAASYYAGGLIGSYTNNLSITADGVCVQGCDINSNSAGGLVGFSNNGNSQIYVKNSKLVNNTFAGSNTAAVMGEAKAEQHWSNVLLKENIFGNETNANKNQGVLIGNASDCAGAYIAGLDIQLTENQTTANSLPSASSKTVYFRNAPSDFDSKSYISFANYTNETWNSKDDGKTLARASAVDPYSNVVPISDISLASGSVEKDGSLYGDGMDPQLANPDASEAASIVREAKDSSGQAGKFVYKNFSTSNYPITSSNMSTVAAENNKNIGDGDADYKKDFPVLLVSSGQDSVISSYLDAITNGGYSSALACNTGGNTGKNARVSATAIPYKYDGNGKLVPDPSEKRASVDVRNPGQSNMNFVVTSGYDNTLERVSLITVTFTAATGQEHVVYVPVVVRRMVQVDFTASMLEGTDFNKADYSELGANGHVLAAYGDTVTALLTYTYNQELNESKEYDWNGHLSAGGSMGPVDKTLKFGSASGTQGNYPVGTQLTLVDCRNGNKMYSYEVSGESSISSVKMSDFVDSSGNHYEPAWMSEIMGVSAAKDNGGTWVMCSNREEASASAKLGSETGYFKPADSDTPEGADRYTLTVGSDDAPSENFYLVVRFPPMESGIGLNGYLDSDVNLSVPKQVNNKLRAEDTSVGGTGWRDSQSNTASTYNILSGYKQSLKDNVGEGVTTLKQNTSDYSFDLSVSDTIAFAEGQLSNDNDKLYYQLDSSLALMNYASSTETQGSATGFPVGTTGTAKFYVHDGDSYFRWNGAEWVSTSKDECAVSYPWESNGGDMKLTLGTSSRSSDAISLHSLRKGRSSLTIDVQMDVHMTDAAHNAGIAASMILAGQDRPSAYTKLLYRGVLATNKARFDSSNSVASITGNHGYYRNESGSSSIALVASIPSQLGINIDDLSLADGTIGAVGSYDLSKLNGSADLIASATRVEYTLTLKQRTGPEGDGEGTYGDVNIGDFLEVKSAGVNNELGSRSGKGEASFTWVDKKDDQGKFKTLDTDSRVFQLPLELKVDTTKDAHKYANYRVELTAKLYRDNTLLDKLEIPSDYITYTLTRVNLKGIE